MKFEWKRCRAQSFAKSFNPNGHEMWCGDREFGYFVTTVDGQWWVFHRHQDWPVGEFMSQEAKSFEDAKRQAEESALKHLN